MQRSSTKFLRLSAIGLALGGLSACGGASATKSETTTAANAASEVNPRTRVAVRSAQKPDAELKDLQTYALVGGISVVRDPEGKVQEAPFDVKSELQFLVERELRRVGMKPVEENPDVYVAYMLAIDALEAESIEEKLKAAPGHLDDEGRVGAGAILVEFAEGASKESIWVGLAEGDTRSDRSEAELRETLDKAVTQIFDELPR